jgi:The GLUG motif
MAYVPTFTVMQPTLHRIPSLRALAVVATLGMISVCLNTTPAAASPTCAIITASWPDSGSVTVASANDLYCAGEDGSTLSRDFVISSDIDLSILTVAVEWRPIGSGGSPFTGSLDGANHTITGLSVPLGGTPDVDDGENGVGLFGAISGASITDLTLTAPSVAGGSRVGSLVGEAIESTIENITATTVTVTADDSQGQVGGLIGYMDATNLTNASVTGSVESLNAAAPQTGGVVGRIDAAYADGDTAPVTTMTNISFDGSVRGALEIGGVLGTGDAAPSDDAKWIRLTDLTSSGSVTSTVPMATSWNWGFGGVIGTIFDSELHELHSSASVTSTGTESGGIIGEMYDSTLQGARASGDVNVDISGASPGTWCDVGGLIGLVARYDRSNSPLATLVLDNLSATGDVSCIGGDAMGGAFGYIADADITDAHASGIVIGTGVEAEGVGGLAGYVYDSMLTDVSASGDVSSDNGYAGGLIAGAYRSDEAWSSRQRDVIITRATTSGSVQGVAYVGGIVGDGGVYSSTPGHIQILSSSTSSAVSGLQSVGGVAGGGDGDFLLRDVVSTGPITGWIDGDATPPSADLGYYGGIVGFLSDTGSIERAYTTSIVTTDIESYEGDGGSIPEYDTASPTVGSMIGRSAGALTGLSFSATDPSTLRIAGQLAGASSANAVYRSASQLGQLATYTTWNDPDTVIVSGWVAPSSRTTQVWGTCADVSSGLPFLQWQRTESCAGPSPTPAPVNTGGAGGTSSTGPSDSTTSGGSVAPVASTPQSPTDDQFYRQPPQATVVTSSVILVPASVAEGTLVRSMRREPSSTLASAPIVAAVVNRPVKLLIPGLVPGTNYLIQVKSGKAYVPLGSVEANQDGQLQLPVFSLTKATGMTIAIVSPSGDASYVKVAASKDRGKKAGKTKSSRATTAGR